MNKNIINSLIVISFLIISCSNNKSIVKHYSQQKKDIVSMELLKQKLDSNVIVNYEKPMKLREFKPYLNGNWIGKAISYGCYRKGQAPGFIGPNENQILEDLEIIIKHWNLIRVYGSDDDTERILKVIKKYDLPIKVLLGVWLENETDNPKRKLENQKQVLKAIQLSKEYQEILIGINVGNETQVFWSAHKMDIHDLIKYLRIIRGNTNLPVTTADDYNFWNKIESKTVADEVDFIMVHIYPLWNGKTLENSIEWMHDIFFNDVKKMHPEKNIVLGEIGWATDYDPTKIGDGQQGSLIKGEVSLSAQEKFLYELDKWIDKYKVTTFLFEAFDEPWKGGGEQSGPREIEKHWGVFYENRLPKESFINFLNKRKQIINNEIN